LRRLSRRRALRRAGWSIFRLPAGILADPPRQPQAEQFPKTVPYVSKAILVIKSGIGYLTYPQYSGTCPRSGIRRPATGHRPTGET
jgi:hypothetical protein